MQPSPSPSAVDAGRLRAALLPVPKGMRVAYGPEIGAFGTLKSTRLGLEAARETKIDRPECAGAAQLDPAKPEIADAPAAVVAYSANRGSITEALVSLPSPGFPDALPEQCASYKATVSGTRVAYRTSELAMPRRGDESRAYLTTASGGDSDAQIGSMVIRRGTVVLSMVVVGRRVKRDGLYELGRLADQKLARITS
ncbi:hypothetical protein ABT294_36235 [Nonomuraea sp. NPDC000554]|uniref:hypothetical protein n=1 Tax=Nonomuraea sp. NPDC000554 TaxID=3154259 RepID=UPI00331B5676